MATVKDIVKKNKQINGPAAATPAVTGVNYLENLSNPVTAANMVTPKTLSASANGTVLNNVKQTAGDVLNSAGQGLSTAKNAVVDTAQNVGNAATKFWNGVVDTASNAVSATGDALDKFGNYTTNLFNGKEETTAPVETVTETPTATVPYMSNVGTANMMTDGEYLKAGENQINWTYDENINYAEQNRQDALRRAEEAKQSAKVEAEALFRQNAANYGIRGEQMLDQGLAGGGYSEFLEGKNMETRAANYARADADAYAAAQNAEAQYNEEVRQANLLRQQGEANLLEKRYEISEKLRAEKDAKIAELVGLANSGYYTVEQLKDVWSAYEGIYGALSDAEINGLLDTTVKEATRSRLNDLIDTYGLGSSEEDFANKIAVGEGISPQLAADLAAAAYAMSNKEQNAQNADILKGILAELQAGRLTTNGAKYLYEQETGKTLDTSVDANGIYKSEEYKLIVEAANKYGSDEKNKRRQQIMSAYTQYYAQVLSGQLSAAEAEKMMEGHGYGGAVGDIAGGEVSNLFDYSEGFAKAEERYKRNNAPALIEFLLETYPDQGVNALDLLAGEGYTKDEIAKYKGLYFETTKNADGSVTYGARKTTLTDDERISLVASAAAAIRSGSMDLESAKAELELRGIELAQGSKEMNYLNTAYNEWLKADAAASADLALYFLMNNNLPVSRDAVKDYFVNTLHKDNDVAEEMLDSIFDASGKLVYQPTKTEGGTTGSTGTTDTDVKDITKMTMAEIHQYLKDNNWDIGGEGGTVDYSVEKFYNILKYDPNFTMSMEEFAKIYDKDGDGNIDEDVLAELSKPEGGPEPEPKPETDPNKLTESEYFAKWEEKLGRALTKEEKDYLALTKSIDGKNFSEPAIEDIKASEFDGVEYEKNFDDINKLLNGVTIWGKTLTDDQRERIRDGLSSGEPNKYIYSVNKLNELIKVEAANDASGYIDSVWKKIEDQKIGTDGLTAILQREKERAKNDGEEAYTTIALQKLEGIFNGGVVTKSFTYNNNGGRKTYNKGDNFSVTDGNRVYRIESEGKVTSDSGTENDKKAVAFANNVANGIKNGEVFGYGSELYMKTEDNVVKIRARRLFGNGQYDELWKAVYGEQIQGLKDAKADIGNYTGYGATVNEGADTKSSKKLGANLQNVADRENSFWEMLMGDGETPTGTAVEAATLTETEKAKVVRGYAQAYAHSGNRYTVTVRGEEFKVGKLGNPLKTEGEYSAINTNILKVASNLDDGEVFIYDENLYTRQGNYVYPIEVSDSKKEKIKNLLSADDKYTFDRGGIYSDAAVSLDGSVKNLAEGATFSKKAGKNVTLTLGEGDDLKKYRFEIDAVLGNNTEAVKAARDAGIKNNSVFAHHEDLYIYTVDENGKGKAYKLGARNGARNADYDAFKAAVTNKDISAENIFGNYKEHLDPGNGGQGGGGSGSTQDPAPNPDSDGGEVEKNETTKVQFDFNTVTAENVNAAVDSMITSWREEAYLPKEEILADLQTQGVTDQTQIDLILGNLTSKTENGVTKYRWYADKQTQYLKDYVDSEGKKLTFSEKADANGTTLRYYDNGNKVALDLITEEVTADDPLYGYKNGESVLFYHDGTVYWYQRNAGDPTQDKFLKIDPGSEDIEIALALAKNEDLPASVGSQNTQNGETEKGKKKNEVTPTAAEWDITRGGASFQTDGALFGIDRNLERGDNITVEIGNKSYAVESKGKVDDAIKKEIAADDNGSIQNNEVFKYSDAKGNSKLYLKRGEEYYEVGQRWYALGQDNKLADAIQGAADKGTVKTMSKETLDTKTVKDAEGKDVETKTNSVQVGGADKLELGRSSKLRINNRKYDVTAANSYGSGSKPYDLAFAKDSGVGENVLFMYEGDVYVKRKDDVVKLGDPIGLDYTKDLKKMLTAESYNNVEVVFLEGLRKKNKGKNYVYGYDDDKGTIWTKSKVKINKAGNEAIKAAADTVSNDTVFKLNDDYYLKVGTDDGYAVYAIDRNNVNGQKKALAKYAEKHPPVDFSKFETSKAKKSGNIETESVTYEAGEKVEFEYVDHNKTVQKGNLTIKQVYSGDAIKALENFLNGKKAGDIFVYDGQVYIVGKDAEAVCSVTGSADDLKTITTRAGESDGTSKVELMGFYGENVGYGDSGTSSNRGFNYSEMV